MEGTLRKRDLDELDALVEDDKDSINSMLILSDPSTIESLYDDDIVKWIHEHYDKYYKLNIFEDYLFAFRPSVNKNSNGYTYTLEDEKYKLIRKSDIGAYEPEDTFENVYLPYPAMPDLALYPALTKDTAYPLIVLDIDYHDVKKDAGNIELMDKIVNYAKSPDFDNEFILFKKKEGNGLHVILSYDEMDFPQHKEGFKIEKNHLMDVPILDAKIEIFLPVKPEKRASVRIFTSNYEHVAGNFKKYHLFSLTDFIKNIVEYNDYDPDAFGWGKYTMYKRGEREQEFKFMTFSRKAMIPPANDLIPVISAIWTRTHPTEQLHANRYIGSVLNARSYMTTIKTLYPDFKDIGAPETLYSYMTDKAQKIALETFEDLEPNKYTAIHYLSYLFRNDYETKYSTSSTELDNNIKELQIKIHHLKHVQHQISINALISQLDEMKHKREEFEDDARTKLNEELKEYRKTRGYSTDPEYRRLNRIRDISNYKVLKDNEEYQRLIEKINKAETLQYETLTSEDIKASDDLNIRDLELQLKALQKQKQRFIEKAGTLGALLQRLKMECIESHFEDKEVKHTFEDIISNPPTSAYSALQMLTDTVAFVGLDEFILKNKDKRGITYELISLEQMRKALLKIRRAGKESLLYNTLTNDEYATYFKHYKRARFMHDGEEGTFQLFTPPDDIGKESFDVENFLKEYTEICIEKDSIKYFEEELDALAYNIQNNFKTRHQFIYVHYGTGGNGKTLFANLLCRMFRRNEVIKDAELDKLQSDNFATASLDKILIYHLEEVPAKSRNVEIANTESKIKRLTNLYVPVREMQKAPRDGDAHFHIIISTNNPDVGGLLTDGSNALLSRFRIISFNGGCGDKLNALLKRYKLADWPYVQENEIKFGMCLYHYLLKRNISKFSSTRNGDELDDEHLKSINKLLINTTQRGDAREEFIKWLKDDEHRKEMTESKFTNSKNEYYAIPTDAIASAVSGRKYENATTKQNKIGVLSKVIKGITYEIVDAKLGRKKGGFIPVSVYNDLIKIADEEKEEDDKEAAADTTTQK